ncbi:MAG: hypothetical protein H5T82_06995, partial [Demequina sp.]|nr:hypothetical protein [Demequina sp.]
IVLDMVRGLPPLLGPTTDRTWNYGAAVLAFRGPETRQGPLFDVLHGAGVLLDRPPVDDALGVAEQLLQDWEHEVAQTIDAGLVADGFADADTRAALVPDAELWDDLIQVFTWMAQEPGLLTDFLRALTDPRSRRLGQIFAEMMRHRDVVGITGPVDDASTWNRDVFFSERVNRDAPNTADNHSIFQRTLSQVHDLSGARICNKANPTLRVLGVNVTFLLTAEQKERCGLIEIEDAVWAFSQSITGDFELTLKSGLLDTLIKLLGSSGDAIIEQSSGIAGLTTHPTPEAMARLIYAPTPWVKDLFDPDEFRTRDGALIVERHDHMVIFTSWERRYRFRGDELIRPAGGSSDQGSCSDPDVECVGFYEAMTPVLDTYYAHFPNVGQGPLCGHITPGDLAERPCFLFAELISALHLHWPHASDDTTQASSPLEPFFAHQSHGATYEPLVADVLSDCVPDAGGSCTAKGARLVTAIHELARALAAIEVRPGEGAIDTLGQAGEFLLDPNRNPGLTDLRGRSVTSTNAGRREVPITPLLLFLDGLNAMDDAFAAAEPERHRRWLDARGLLVDRLLEVECPSDGPCRVSNRRVLEAARVLVPFLRERIAFHRDAGDLTDWARTLGARAGDTIGSPLGSAAIHLADAVQEDPESRLALARLVAFFLDSGSPDEAFANLILSAADMLQWLEDDRNIRPLLAALAPALAPNARALVEGTGDGAPDIEGSAADLAVRLLRAISAVDDERSLRELSQNLVALPDGGRVETPLEVIVDVLAEVNRADARLNEGTHLNPEDYEYVLDRSVDFLTDEHRGLERL